MQGYLDRIEDGGKAVIILEEQGFEIILSVQHLPEGSRIGSWFRIYERDGGYSFVLDEEERIRREQLVNRITRKLKMKSQGSKFKRK
ncbi:DUF3006 family protein [Planococcus beigongshangi]|uniref:DUF3006 family protein n=1 Tax=Planococcus beigongshangi TaxID=2782536 RepID=UPI00193C333C